MQTTTCHLQQMFHQLRYRNKIVLGLTVFLLCYLAVSRKKQIEGALGGSQWGGQRLVQHRESLGGIPPVAVVNAAVKPVKPVEPAKALEPNKPAKEVEPIEPAEPAGLGDMMGDMGGISCGQHRATSCAVCTKGDSGDVGQDWCHGDCHWTGTVCLEGAGVAPAEPAAPADPVVPGSVSCGQHRVSSCSLCPEGNLGDVGEDWCHGDCVWKEGRCGGQ